METGNHTIELRVMKIGRGDAADGIPYTVPVPDVVRVGDVIEPHGPTGRCYFTHPDVGGKTLYQAGDTLTAIYYAKFALGIKATGATFNAGDFLYWDRTNRLLTNVSAGNRRCGRVHGPVAGRYGNVPADSPDGHGVQRVFFEFDGDLT